MASIPLKIASTSIPLARAAKPDMARLTATPLLFAATPTPRSESDSDKWGNRLFTMIMACGLGFFGYAFLTHCYEKGQEYDAREAVRQDRRDRENFSQPTFWPAEPASQPSPEEPLLNSTAHLPTHLSQDPTQPE